MSKAAPELRDLQGWMQAVITHPGGIVAGVHTQPAVLSYSLEQSDNDLPNIGYATVFPIATIAKLLLAQLLLVVL